MNTNRVHYSLCAILIFLVYVFLFQSSVVAQQIPDKPNNGSIPPALIDISFDPSEIDTTSQDQLITITVVITGGLGAGAIFAPEDWRWWYPNDELSMIVDDQWTEETPEGVALTRRYRRPQGMVGGKWVLTHFYMNPRPTEERGYKLEYKRYVPEYEWPQRLEEFYFTDTSTVTSQYVGQVDLDNLVVAPYTTGASRDDLALDIEATFSTIRGFREAEITFASPNSNDTSASATFRYSTGQQIDGDQFHGTYASQLVVPGPSAPGEWTIKSIYIESVASSKAFWGDCDNCAPDPLIGQTAFELQDTQYMFLPIVPYRYRPPQPPGGLPDSIKR